MRSKTSTHAVRVPALARRSFTMLEMVVVLVLLGILIAFTYPRLSGNETLARDRRAQTSASAALDAVSTVFSSIGTSASVPTPPEAPPSASTCTLYVSPAVRSIMDRATYPVQDLTQPASATMCPVFANPAALASTTGDVQFAVPAAGDPAGHPAPSTGLNSASVAAVRTDFSWRVGVAVLSPQGGAGTTKTTISTCWMAWREYPLNGVPSASARERYFYTTASNLSADATNCTGTDAVGRGTPPSGTDAYVAMLNLGAAALAQDGECELPTHGEPVRGLSWLSPCGDYN